MCAPLTAYLPAVHDGVCESGVLPSPQSTVAAVGQPSEAPEAIDIILIDRPELAPTGAGEASSRPTAGALANAIFDATGIRLRQAPFTPERLKAGLA